MGSVFARFILFLSSYFPLALIFFILFVARRPWPAVLILLVGLTGVFGLMIYRRTVNRLSSITIKVAAVQKKDSEAMSYIVSYVIPFLAIPFEGWEQGIALTVFFFVLAVIYVNSNMIHINPMLNLFKYHLYEITLEDGGIHSLITKRRVLKGDVLSVVKVGEDIMFERNKDNIVKS